MHINTLWTGFGLAILLSLAGAEKARPAIVIFKDGFYIQGKVKQPRDYIVDPSGANFTVPMAGGYYYVDDGVRRVIFSPGQVHEVLDDPKGAKTPMQLRRTGTSLVGDSILPGWELEHVGNFDSKWERVVTVYISKTQKRINLLQRMTFLTPRLARVDTMKYDWLPYYFTSELEPKVVRPLLDSYYMDQKNMKESEKRLNIIRFYYEAGWVDEAGEELEKFIKAFPALEKDAASHRESIRARQAGRLVDDIVQAYKVGQYAEVQEGLERYTRNDLGKVLEPKQQAQIQEIKNKLETSQAKLKDAPKLLTTLVKHVAAPDRPFFTQAGKTIAGELNLDTLGRLETFLVYAEQFQREIKQKRKHSQKAEEVLALAITGWLQGNSVAEPDVKTAVQLWQARQMVLEYQKTSEQAARKQLLESFIKENPGFGADVLAQLIRMLSPPEPFEKIDAKLGAQKPMEMKIEVEGPAQGQAYHLQLPPGYHHNRPYPVLILLHAAAEKPGTMLTRFSDLAARHGFILAAPVWGKGFKFSYSYSPREHAIVTECIRDLRRRFQVDSDRVFMFGWRQGGTMAFDVGLSHPDLFAGVVTVNGSPKFFSARYWPNGQYLPFYAVEGDFNSNNPKTHRTLFKDWIRWGYPSLYVEYKGRASEWFTAELPTVFDWMSRKRRLNPARQLGRDGEEFKSMRQCDNHFYWLTTSEVLPKCLNSYEDWKVRTPPATMQARIATGNELIVKKGGVASKTDIWNQINVRAFGVRNLSIWLGPKMIDYTKKVQLRVNGSATVPRLVQPSLPILMEQFYQQGDRQRLYFARLDVRF
jgi:pimeloyl-ACP methyl ester carboxylesterase